MKTGDPWRCPNVPPCPHPGVLHDIYDRDDERPICCAEGCECGRPACVCCGRRIGPLDDGRCGHCVNVCSRPAWTDRGQCSLRADAVF